MSTVPAAEESVTVAVQVEDPPTDMLVGEQLTAVVVVRNVTVTVAAVALLLVR